MTFKGLLLEESGGKVSSKITTLEESALPPGEVTVDVAYSTLNYKDGMVLNGLGRLVRNYPHVPGIDFAGTVAESSSPDCKPGDQVVLTGWGVGEQRWGGYAQKARVKASELVKLPHGLSLKQAMAVGTAGFTAMLAARALEDHGLKPEAGEVLVTGASGGVGSVAVAILAAWGYSVAASTGRAANGDYLKSLGAKTIIDRAEIAQPKRPLDSERWAGCIDAVGGQTLACVMSQLKYGMSAASCGLAGGNELATTVIPFLLAGRQSARDRLGALPDAAAAGRVEAAGGGSAAGQARCHDRDGGARRAAGDGRAYLEGRGARPGGGRCEPGLSVA